MRYFTPELFVQFNSDDDEVADRADEAWEKALRQYRKQIKSLRSSMSVQVRQLTRLNLHDAEIVGIEIDLDNGTPLAFVTVLKDDSLYSLVYVLTSAVVRSASINSWPFSKSYKHWLYDEVDVVEANGQRFEHRIMLSDGSTIRIPFHSVIINRTSLKTPAKRRVLMAIG